MKKIILILIVALSSFAHAEDEYTKTAFEFMEVSGTNEAQRTMLRQMFTQFQQMQPNNPKLKDIGALMEKELKNLNKKLVPIYKKHLSLEDLKSIIKLYKNPALKKMVAKQPQIIKESMTVGMVWGQELAKRVLEK